MAATKDDLETVTTVLRSRMQVGAALRTEMAELRTDITDAMSRQIEWIVTFAAARSSLRVAAVRVLS